MRLAAQVASLPVLRGVHYPLTYLFQDANGVGELAVHDSHLPPHLSDLGFNLAHQDQIIRLLNFSNLNNTYQILRESEDLAYFIQSIR